MGRHNGEQDNLEQELAIKQSVGVNGATGVQTQTSLLIQNLISQSQKQQKEKTRFQMTAYDILFNPLRAEHPFGKFNNDFADLDI